MHLRALKRLALSVPLIIFILIGGDRGGVSLVQGQPSCTATLKAGESVQQAIDAASTGAVICLNAGTFQENVTIAKSLMLRGEGRDQTLLKGLLGGKPVIRIENESEVQVTLDGLTAAAGKLGAGLRVGGKVKVAVNNSTVSDSFFGLFISGSASVTLTNSQITKNQFDGLRVEGASTVNFQNTRIVGNALDGLAVKDTAQVEIRDSVIDDNIRCGIEVVSSEAQVRGALNEMKGNGADLCGFAAASLRKPLVAQTDKNQLTVPGDYASLQEAVDAIAPGGVVTVQKGSYEVGLTLWKPLTLAGAGKTETVLKALPERQLVGAVIGEAQGVVIKGLSLTGSQGDGFSFYGQATLQDVQVSESKHDGLKVAGSATVTLQGTQVSGNKSNGLSVLDKAVLTLADSHVLVNGSIGLATNGSATVHLINSEVSSNQGRGLDVGNSSQLTLSNSRVSGNRDNGLVVRDLAQVRLVSAQVLGNGGDGVSVLDKTQVTLSDSTIASNESDGLAVNGSATVEVRQSVLENNGTLDECRRADVTCNGLIVVAEAKVNLLDSVIRNNTDWGVSSWLRRCGAPLDFFTGQVVFGGTNTIMGNNKSGNHNGKGNPGNHAFRDLPDGQVCLP